MPTMSATRSVSPAGSWSWCWSWCRSSVT